MRTAVLLLLLAGVMAVAALLDASGEVSGPSENAATGAKGLKAVNLFIGRLPLCTPIYICRPAIQLFDELLPRPNGGKSCSYPCIPKSCEGHCDSGKCPYWCCLCACEGYPGPCEHWTSTTTTPPPH